MDHIVQNGGMPLWSTLKMIGVAALSLFMVHQTIIQSAGLVPYKGSFLRYSRPVPPAPVVIEIALDLLKPLPNLTYFNDVHPNLNDTSTVMAYQQANVSETVVHMMVTANASTRCFATAADGANQDFFINRLVARLISCGSSWSRLVLRGFAYIALLHNAIIDSIPMGQICIPLAALATVGGGYWSIQQIREICKVNAAFARALEDEKLEVDGLREAVEQLKKTATALEKKATHTEETKKTVLRQLFRTSLRLYASQKKHMAASTAIVVIKTALTAAETAGQTNQKAEDNAKAALNTAISEKTELSGVKTAQASEIDQQRRKISDLENSYLSIQNELQEAQRAATKAQKSFDKEIERLTKVEKDSKDKLHKQGQNVQRLQDDIKKLKQISPAAVEKLQSQLADKEEAHQAAKKSIADLEIAKVKAEQERKTNESHLKESSKKLEEAQETVEAAQKIIAEMEAAKKKTEAALQSQESSNTETVEKLRGQIDEAVRDRKAAESHADSMQSQVKKMEEDAQFDKDHFAEIREKMATADAERYHANEQLETLQEKLQLSEDAKAAAETAKRTSENLLEQERADTTTREQERVRSLNELQKNLEEANEELQGKEAEFEALYAQTKAALAEKDATIQDLMTRLSAPASTSVDSSDVDSVLDSADARNDEQPGPPAVTLPPTGSSDTSSKNAGLGDQEASFSGKGVSGRLVDTPNDTTGPSTPVKRPSCPRCRRNHAGKCKYTGPLPCIHCDKNHAGACRLWCKVCEALHYESECPKKGGMPCKPSQGPNAAESVGGPTPHPVSPTSQGAPRATIPASGASPGPRPQRGSHGNNTWTAPRLGRHVPSPAGFVPIPAAQRHGPANGMGRGGRHPANRFAQETAAESFRRQHGGRGS